MIPYLKTFSIFSVTKPYNRIILNLKVMKKQLFIFAAFLLMGFGFSAYAQPSNLKKQEISGKSISTPDAKVNKLKRPANIKGKPMAPTSSRGDVYGPDYSDVVIDNWTGYYIDIYVNGSFRGTVSPYDKRVTWAIPGTNTLYAKAVFNDGSYLYWGPQTTYTGYSYTWKLNP